MQLEKEADIEEAREESVSPPLPSRKRSHSNVSTTINSWEIRPPFQEKWIIKDIDVGQKFYLYQTMVKNKFVEMQGYVEIENSLYDLL